MTKFPRPIFLVNAPRSGSTLLTLILDAHPAIAVPSPAWLYEIVRPFLYSYGDLSKPENIRELAQDILDSETIKQWNTGFSAGDLVKASRENSFKGLFAALHEHYADGFGKSRWGEKTPRNSFWVDEIKADFPDAQFVHIVRDGRDMAIDIAQTTAMRPRSVYAGAFVWRDFVSAIRISAAKLNKENYYEFRYEDLCADPELTLKKLCDYLGEDFDPVMLAHFETKRTKEWTATSHHSKAGKPITTEFCEMYKTRLTERDISALDAEIGDLLKTYGYPVNEKSVALPEREAMQIAESDVVTGPRYDSYRSELEQRRIKRKERGVYSDADRTQLLRSLI